MNKTDVIEKVAAATGKTKKETAQTIDATLKVITAAFEAGERVNFPGFGTFETRKRVARKGRNPQTGEDIDIPSHVVPAFKPGKTSMDAAKRQK